VGMYLLKKGYGFDEFVFDKDVLTDFGISKEELDEIVELGEPFVTKGCPNCNRPFSTESPGGPFYNYPEKPEGAQVSEIKKELGMTGQRSIIERDGP
jgi:lipoyl synthase